MFSGPSLRLHLLPDHGQVRRDLNQRPRRQAAAAQPRREPHVSRWEVCALLEELLSRRYCPPRSTTLLQPALSRHAPCTQPAASKILPLSCKHLLAPGLKSWWFSAVTLQGPGAAGSTIHWAHMHTKRRYLLRAEPRHLPRRDGDSWSRWELPPT